MIDGKALIIQLKRPFRFAGGICSYVMLCPKDKGENIHPIKDTKALPGLIQSGKAVMFNSES